ncbi:hypothetical protein B1B05_18980 [Domibacillus enclensis]|uniref:Uncharacterized protein n=1 Tax=Domibacillus enclensis TaxID=1017273 RepID=A0ABX4E851_9BACI|nr:hypothetical protein B1B05_18980 [Domibacillus enclensis]
MQKIHSDNGSRCIEPENVSGVKDTSPVSRKPTEDRPLITMIAKTLAAKSVWGVKEDSAVRLELISYS